MEQTTDNYLQHCLYFTANSLARTVSRLAEEEFGKLGLCSSHAFLMMLVIEQPGISQKVLADHLHLAQSTVSRFTDALIRRGLLTKESEGKQVQISPTPQGEAMMEPIQKAWFGLYERLNQILGKDEGDRLTSEIFAAYQKLAAEE